MSTTTDRMREALRAASLAVGDLETEIDEARRRASANYGRICELLDYMRDQGDAARDRAAAAGARAGSGEWVRLASDQERIWHEAADKLAELISAGSIDDVAAQVRRDAVALGIGSGQA